MAQLPSEVQRSGERSAHVRYKLELRGGLRMKAGATVKPTVWLTWKGNMDACDRGGEDDDEEDEDDDEE